MTERGEKEVASVFFTGQCRPTAYCQCQTNPTGEDWDVGVQCTDTSHISCVFCSIQAETHHCRVHYCMSFICKVHGRRTGVPRRTARCCRRPGSTFLDGHSPTVGYKMLEELDSSENPRFLCSWTLRHVLISARCAVTSIFIAIVRPMPTGKLSLTAITSLSKSSLGITQRYRRKPKQLKNKQKLRTTEREHVKKKTNSMKFKWF